jgi:arylsulfatase A-like enzyme
MTYRSTVLTVVALLAVMLPWAASHAADVPAKKRPNIVIILADDLGAKDLGYTGSTFYETPNIDALSKKGMVFNSAYSTCPVCSPSRASIMTGKYPARVGVTDYIGGPQPAVAATRPIYKDRLLPAPYNVQLALEETTVAEAFREAGYTTLCAGKWHLGGPKFSPEKQGFDEAFEAPDLPRVRDGGAKTASGTEASGVQLAHLVAQWIAKQPADGKPFFAYFASHDPHIPLRPTKADLAYFEAKRAKLKLADEFKPDGASNVRQTQANPVYAAIMKALDDEVGIVVKQLEDQKLLDNTIIVFASDNGGLSTAEGTPTANVPLRAGKGWAYEGGIRVPLIAVVPGVTKPGSTSDQRVILGDLFPTLLAACDLPLRPKDHLDAISILPALRGENLRDRPLFWHYPHYGNQGGSPFSSIREGDWKLIVFHDTRQGVELYNEAADPSETKNLAAEQPDRVASMRAQLEAWKKEVGAVDASPKKPAANVDNSKQPQTSQTGE